jgi:hypothetical protein
MNFPPKHPLFFDIIAFIKALAKAQFSFKT